MPTRFNMTKKAKERLRVSSAPIQRHLSIAIDLFMNGQAELIGYDVRNANGKDHSIYTIRSQDVIFCLIEKEEDCVWLASFYVLFDSHDVDILYT